MYHILRVTTLQCRGLEPSVELGFFPADDLESAIACAKESLETSEATLVEIIPFGAKYKKDGKPDKLTSHTVVWEHDPNEHHHTCEACERMNVERKKDEVAGPLPSWEH